MEALVHRWLAWGVVAVAAVTFVALLVVDAPYGRHRRGGWGKTLPVRWMWVIMELPASLGFVVVFLLGRHRFELVPLLFLALWQLHYVHRTFIYPFQIRAADRRAPVVVALLGMTFQCVNGYLNARFISELGDYPASWLTDLRLWAGVALFFAGRHINRSSDAILLALRDKGSDYAIPHGGLFRWVSCPNYFGEIVEWTGWAVLTWSLSGLAFALYTFANLAPRALAHHRWYEERFADYPRRRALIPFVL